MVARPPFVTPRRTQSASTYFKGRAGARHAGKKNGYGAPRPLADGRRAVRKDKRLILSDNVESPEEPRYSIRIL